MLCGALLSTAVALLIGIPSLRLRGVYLASGTLRNTTVVKNDAGYGGGVYVADNAAAQVVDCIVWGNVAYLDGGDARPNWGIAGTKPTLQTKQTLSKCLCA